MSNCCPLEVVGRGSETHFQVGLNFNNSIYRFMGEYVNDILCMQHTRTWLNQRLF